jgi:anthranilate phosphoribosyltransferase
MKPGVDYSTVLKKLKDRKDLGIEEAEQLLEAIFAEELTEIQMATLLALLAWKGESISEIIGFARGMRRHAVKLSHQVEGLVDTAGTGGDNAGTFNISTAAAFVIAGAGVPVAKHGNRAISGRCGSADVLAYLGVKIDAQMEILENCLRTCGITFLFAPVFHPAMRIVARVRREMRIRTIFNLLGPLSNPAGVKRQIIGVCSPHLTETFVRVLDSLGCERALVFYGEEGLDEISISGRTRVSELIQGSVRTFCLNPEDLGLPRASPERLLGGDPAQNGSILHEILQGKINGAPRDAVLSNAAAGIYVAGRAESLGSGVTLAKESLESGQALRKLEQLIAMTNSQPV